ncbi:MAG TPA: Vms1/Ankzf1 family peptidyl-tRNA hydrolase [Jatrophihabitans sp.]|nr:Vms1/Ankzf1 family peptidyl-tRNA hydrolase [Jatrophihabitans sp.]
MALPAEITAIYQHSGPYATAFLDGSRDHEQGEHQVQLRWRTLRARLEAAGADEATLQAMQAAVDSDRPVPGRHGHLLVAAGGALLADEIIEQPPITEVADFGPAPQLLPFLALRGEPVPHVVVVADRNGANLYANAGHSPIRLTGTTPDSVAGSAPEPIRKTGRNVWSEDHFQHRVENNWTENAADVAQAARKVAAELGARVVLVAGDVRARALVLHALAELVPPQVEVTETTAGGRAEGASLAAVEDAAHDAVLRVRWRDRREILARLQQGVARADFGVTGIEAVLQALRSGQVETLVISDDPSSTERAWIGDDPLQLTRTEQQLTDLGITEPRQVRLDAALVRAVAASGADLLVTPNAHSYLVDGIGAVLRYARNPGTVS